MSNELFVIDSSIWNLNDPRVKSLKDKDISQAQFLTLIKPEDPFEMQSGRLVYVSEEEEKKRIAEFIEISKGQIKLSGGISGNFILENKNLFLQVYPELAGPVKEVEDVISKENCKGCARNKHTNKLVQVLSTLPKGRDVTILKPLFSKMPYAETWLSGNEVIVDEKSIQIPPFFRKSRNFIKQELEVPEAEYTPGRKQCIDCGKKHVAQALVLLREAEKGYPEHAELAYRHLKKAGRDIPDHLKDSFTKMFKILEDEIKVLDLKKIHNISMARKLIEDYLKDPSDPTHLPRWLAIGHLAEAEDEAINDYPELANDIRKERLALMENSRYDPALEFLLRKAVNTPVKDGSESS